MNNNLISLASKLKKFNSSFIKKKHRIVTDKTIHNSSFLFFTFFLREKSFFKSPYRNILINYFKKAEQYYPGSSYFVSVRLVELIFNDKIKESKITKVEKNIDVIFKYMESISNKKTFNFLKDVLYFSGADATISCFSSKNVELVVQKKCNPSFNIKLDESFSNVYFTNQNQTTKSFIVSIVDGFIERDTEIFSLFEICKKEKLPAILICRGISEDAKRNIKQIILKNKIYVYPYLLKFDNHDPFLLKDIAKSCKTSVVSSEYYDNIYKDLEEKTSICKLTISKNNITFHEKSEDLINEINSQLKNQNIDFEARQYLQKRKRRASPNNVLIEIPNNMNNLLQELKSLIVCYNFCVKQGIYIYSNNSLNSKQCHESSKILSEKLYINLQKIGYTIKLDYKNESRQKLY